MNEWWRTPADAEPVQESAPVPAAPASNDQWWTSAPVADDAPKAAAPAAPTASQNWWADSPVDETPQPGKAIDPNGLAGAGLPPVRPKGLGHNTPLDTGLNVPETPQTQAAQQQAVAEGRRPAAMFPKGSEEPALPPGMARMETPRGVFHFDPMTTSPTYLRRMSRLGRENEALGLGPYNKPDVQKRIDQGEPPLAVTERQPDGTEVKAAIGTPSTAPEQQAAIAAGAAPGNGVGVEPLEGVVGGRFPNGVPAPPVRPAGLGAPKPQPMGPPIPTPDPGNMLDDPGKFRDRTGSQDQMLTGEQAYNERAGALKAAESELDFHRQRYLAAKQRADAIQNAPVGRRGSGTEQQRQIILDELKSAQTAVQESTRDLGALKRAPLPRMEAGRSSGEAVGRAFVNFIPKSIEGLALYAEGITGKSLGSRSLRDFQDAVDEKLQGDPARREEFLDKMGSGAGSALGFMLGGSAARLAGVPQKLASGTLGGSGQAADYYREAESKGKKGFDLAVAYATGGAIGATEMFGIGSTLERMDKATAGGVRRYFGLMLREGGEEAVQEATQQLLENMAKYGLYGEDVPLTKDVAENALIGALLGVGMAGATGIGTLSSRNRLSRAEADINAAGGVKSAPEEISAFLKAASEAQQRQTPGLPAPDQQSAPAAAEQPAAPPTQPQEQTPASAAPTPAQNGDINQQQPQQAAPESAPAEPDQPAQPAQPAQPPADTPETRTLRAAGWADEDIADLSPRQMQQAMKDAENAGFTDPGPGTSENPSGKTPEGSPPISEPASDAGTRAKPVTVTEQQDITPAAAQVNTEPTEAQKAAGNYKMGHARYDGMDLSIETPKGATRTGTDADGEKWSVQMPAAYGYIKGSTGADGDKVDVFVGDGAPNGKVFVIDQYDPKTGKFDEHKAIVGVNTEEEAAALYHQAYPGGPKSRLGGITELTTQEFKTRLAKGQLKKAFAPKPATSTENVGVSEKIALNEYGHYVGQKVEVTSKNGAAHFTGTVERVDSKGNVIVKDESGKSRVIDNPMRVAGINENTPDNPDKTGQGSLEPVRVRPDSTATPDPHTQAVSSAIRQSLEKLKVPTEGIPNDLLDLTAKKMLEGMKIGDAMLAAATELTTNQDQNYDTALDVKAKEAEADAAEAAANAKPKGGKKDATTKGTRGAKTQPADAGTVTAEAGTATGPGTGQSQSGDTATGTTEGSDQAPAGTRDEGNRPAGEGAVSENGAKPAGDGQGQQGGKDSQAGTAEGSKDDSEVTWQNAKPGDTLPDGSILVGKGIATRTAAKNIADGWPVPARVILDGPRKFAVVADKNPAPQGGVSDSTDTRDDFDKAFDAGLDAAYGKPDEPAAAPAPKKPRERKPKAESPTAKVEMPDGYTLQSARRMFGHETTAQNRPTGTFKAVVTRNAPHGAYDGYGATYEASIADALEKAQKSSPQKKADKWTQIGVNARGNPVFEDENGVRSYTERGIRVTESVTITPTRDGMRMSVDTSNRGSDYTTVEQPSKAQTAKSAAKNTIDAADAALKGLAELFGGKGKFSSGLTFDSETWAKAKPMFIQAARKFADAAADVRKLVQLIIADMKENYGFDREGMNNMRPYVRRLIEEVENGTINLQEESDGPATGALDKDGKPQNQPEMADGGDGVRRPAEPLEGAAPEDGQGSRPDAGADAGSRPVQQDGGLGDGKPESGDATDGRAGASGEGLASDGAGGRGNEPEPAATRPNYHIADPAALVGGSPKVRFARNRAAIEAARAIEEEGRDPTQEELDAMAAYIGWGSFGQELFQGTWERSRAKDNWQKEDTWLREHLGKDEWESAQRSIINAHYTDPPTVNAMWDMLRKMGFAGGRVLEPSMGIGNFFGLMPRDMMANSDLTGIELDGLTGGMAKILYPHANIQIKGYEKSKTPDNFYDVVIGNWPFADVSVPDRRYDQLSPNLHDYFFVKALDQVRPGGIVMGITSAGTMDKMGKSVRIHLAKNAELVAAYRLPSGAFEQYAGTSVVTDIIILKKRSEPVVSVANENWIEVTEVPTPAGTDVRINKYYADNPSHVLGTVNFGSGSTYGRPSMIVDRPADIAERLDNLKNLVPETGYDPVRRGKEPRFISNNTKDRQGSITYTAPRTNDAVQSDDKGPFVVQGERLVRLEDLVKFKVKNRAETFNREDQLSRLVEIRQQYGALIDAEREGAENAEKLRGDLKKSYDAFRKKHGPISDSDGIAIFRRAKEPSTSSLSALERPDGSPSLILTEKTIRSVKKLENPSIRDAFVLARNESKNIDLGRVAEIAGKPVADVEKDLLSSKAVYRTPGNGFEVSDVYLSGNVRRKLREAEEAAQQGEDMAGSIEALKSVLPKDVPYFQIEAQLGATWVENSDYQQFIADLLGVGGPLGIEVRYSAGSWKAKFTNGSFNRRPEATTTWGHERYRFDKLITAAMNNQTVKIYDRTEDGPQFNELASKEVNEKALRLREEYSAWAWRDAERRVRLEKNYNEVMNAIATPNYDGSFLEFPGMTLKRGDDQFSLRKHQVDAIWRGVANGRGIFAHEVGTGKTYTMGGIAVESRRYGVSRKPMILAHNANSASVAREIQEMYPGAKILYVDNLTPDTIDTTLRRIANDEWDAVVIPHSVADRLSLREETLMEIAREEIAALEEEAYAAADEDGIDLRGVNLDDEEAVKKIRSVTAKNLVKQRQRIIAKIQKMAQRSSREGAIAFEDLGIDSIIIDEAHEFKKPPIATKMQLKGLNTGTSDRSIALKFLTDYVKKLNGGKGTHVFTGTPITNTLTEIYNMMRFVMEDQMALDGISGWDPWFNTFAAAATDVELTATGEYEPITRLSAFVNVAELRRMAGQYMDIVFADDMPEFAPRPTSSGKTIADTLTEAERAELVDGRSERPVGRPYKKIISDVGAIGPQQQDILEELSQRARRFKNMSKKDRRDAMMRGDEIVPIRVETDAANASLDVRLFDITGEDHPDSKVNRTVKNVAKHYNEHPLSTQVIFVERGFSDFSEKSVGDVGAKTKIKVERFNLVKDMVAKLVASGIPREQIAIVDGSMSKEKRKETADKMNKAIIRVAIGNSATLGVGVNMQENLRAMHHMDAPWMPGLLEQRNGRGHRQGNKWNTVLEYRYITEKLDGRRWQVLAVKDRFIKAFLHADESIRVIEGDAVDDSEGGDDISKTLADAAGDPRLLLINKFKADVLRLQGRERLHTTGIADAIWRTKELNNDIIRYEDNIELVQKDADKFDAAREKGFTAVIDGKTYSERKDAQAALDAYITKNGNVTKGAQTVQPLNVTVQGFPLAYRWFLRDEPTYAIRGALEHEMGKASIASAEGIMRGFQTRVDQMRETVEDKKVSITRLNEASKAPFQQASLLVAKKKMLADIEADLQANPVPAPSWLRHGAPVDTVIYVNGEERSVEGHKWTDDGYYIVTKEGLVPYLDAKDSLGAPIFDARPFSPPVINTAAPAAPGAPAPRAQAMPSARPRLTQKAIDAGLDEAHIVNVVTDIVDKVVGPGRVSIGAAQSLTYGEGGVAAGTFNAAAKAIQISTQSQDKRVTGYHEAFHALQTFGVFSPQEIAILHAEAPRHRTIIQGMYGRHQDDGSQVMPDSELPTGETSAHAFGHYAAARDAGRHPYGMKIGIRNLFERMYAIMRRIRAWAAGLGFQTSEDIFERARTGQYANIRNDGLSWDQDSLRAELWNETPEGAKIERAMAMPRRAPTDRSKASHFTAYTADDITRQRELQRQYHRDSGRQPIDVHAAYGALNTRVAEHIETLSEDEMQPMLDLVEAAGGRDQVNDFLYARHAQERNAWVASIRPGMPDGGSGMDNATAQSKLAAYQASPDYAALVAAADAIYAMNDADLDRREAAGLMTAQQVTDIRSQYTYYVPLRGFAGDEYLDGPSSGGQGVSVRGKEYKSALGRNSEADDIIAQTILKSIEGIMRTEKNRVDQQLMRFAQQLEAHYGSVDSPMIVRRANQLPFKSAMVNGSVQMVRMKPEEFSNLPDVIALKVNGKQVWVQLQKETQLADAFKNALFEHDDVGLRALAAATGVFAKLRTAWNVFFAPVNFVRDIEDALIYVTASLGRGGKRALAKEMPNAFREAFKFVMLGHRTPAFDQFREAGAKMSWAKFRSIDDIKREIDRRLNGAPLALRPFLMLKTMVENWNDIFENTVRFAMFSAARKMGKSIDASTKVALEGTLNFHRRGHGALLKYARAVLPFINPSIQSPLRAGRMIRDAGGFNTRVGRTAMAVGAFRAARRTYLGLTILGFLGGLLNYVLGGDDDDGIPFWDKAQADFRNNKNLMFYYGGSDANGKPNAITIPAFAEIMLPYKLGGAIASAIMGKRSAVDIAADLGKTAYALSPTEGRGFVPSIFSWLTDIGDNKNWLNQPIHRDPRFAEKGIPKHMVSRESTPQAWKDIARGLYSVGINIHPEDVRHIAREMTGGYYQPGAWAAGKAGIAEPQSGMPPGVRPFFAPGSDLHTNFERQRLDKMQGEANTRRAEFVSNRTSGKQQNTQGVVIGPRGGVSTPVGKVMADMQKELKPLFKSLTDARRAGNETEIDRVQTQIANTQKRFRIQAERARGIQQ